MNRDGCARPGTSTWSSRGRRGWKGAAWLLACGRAATRGPPSSSLLGRGRRTQLETASLLQLQYEVSPVGNKFFKKGQGAEILKCALGWGVGVAHLCLPAWVRPPARPPAPLRSPVGAAGLSGGQPQAAAGAEGQGALSGYHGPCLRKPQLCDCSDPSLWTALMGPG